MTQNCQISIDVNSLFHRKITSIRLCIFISNLIYLGHEENTISWRLAQELKGVSEDTKHDVGYQLDKVQRGEQPDDFKPMPSIEKGVEEIRVRDDSGIYRVIYTARLADAVYVLHAFQKKTQTTAKRDIALATKRYAELMIGA